MDRVPAVAFDAIDGEYTALPKLLASLGGERWENPGRLMRILIIMHAVTLAADESYCA